MAHLNHQKYPRAGRVPDEWLPATASLTAYLIGVTKNHAIASKVGPRLAQPVGTAVYVPSLSEIQINSDTILKTVVPEDVNFSDSLFRARHPLAVGAAIHEAAHASFSGWTPQDVRDALPKNPPTRRQLEILAALEEHRIEAEAIKGFHGLDAETAQKFLPSIVFELLASDLRPDAKRDHYQASILVALVLARASVGIVSEESISSFTDLVAEFFDTRQVNALLDVARDYRNLDAVGRKAPLSESDATELIELANRWLTIVAEAIHAQESTSDTGESEGESEGTGDAEGEGEGESEGTGDAEGESEGESEGTGDAEGESEGESEGTGDAEGESEGEGEATSVGGTEGGSPASVEKILKEITEGSPVMDEAVHDHEDSDHEGDESADSSSDIRELAKHSKHEHEIDLLDEVKKIKQERAKALRELDKQRRKVAARYAKAAAKNNIDLNAVGVQQRLSGEVSRVTMRVPTAAERTAATIFARKLSDVVSVEPTVTKVAMDKPGKKLRTRALVQRHAQAAQGRRPTARHWEGKQRQVGDNPKLRVGAALDVSGSMGSLAEPLGLVAYILGNGINKAGGDFAQTAFGQGSSLLVPKGRPVPTVPIARPACMTEDIKSSVLTLDHELDLIDGDGVRVLILASDGNFVDYAQEAWANEMFPAIAAKGVILLHLDLSERGSKGGSLYGPTRYPDQRHNNPYAPLVVDGTLPAKEIATKIGDRILEEVAKQSKKNQ